MTYIFLHQGYEAQQKICLGLPYLLRRTRHCHLLLAARLPYKSYVWLRFAIIIELELLPCSGLEKHRIHSRSLVAPLLYSRS